VGLSGYSGGGERGIAPGADFNFASSDFKTLGAFFCNFSEPRLATAPVAAPRGSARAARRRGRGGAAQSPVCSSRRRGFRDPSSVSSDFNALRGGKFPSGPARRVRQRSCGSRPQRTVSRAPVYQMLWLEASETKPFPGADSIFSSRCGAISGRPRLAVSARNLSSGLGLTRKQEKKRKRRNR
jgi:hypothetical protein